MAVFPKRDNLHYDIAMHMYNNNTTSASKQKQNMLHYLHCHTINYLYFNFIIDTQQMTKLHDTYI